MYVTARQQKQQDQKDHSTKIDNIDRSTTTAYAPDLAGCTFRLLQVEIYMRARAARAVRSRSRVPDVHARQQKQQKVMEIMYIYCTSCTTGMYGMYQRHRSPDDVKMTIITAKMPTGHAMYQDTTIKIVVMAARCFLDLAGSTCPPVHARFIRR